MTELDRDIALTGDRPPYDAHLAAGWVVGGGVNGGYQLAVVGGALGRAVAGKPHPIAVSAHYLSAARPGPATVTTHVLREGTSVATLSATLTQGEDDRLAVLATYGDLAVLPDDVRTTATPPDLPPLEECVPSTSAPQEVRDVAPLMERFDLRLDPRHVGWRSARRAAGGSCRAGPGWPTVANPTRSPC